jgi:hypothetical protein
MSEDLRILDDIRACLVATYYRDGRARKRWPASRSSLAVPAGAILAAGTLVVVLVLVLVLRGGVVTSQAAAALDAAGKAAVASREYTLSSRQRFRDRIVSTEQMRIPVVSGRSGSFAFGSATSVPVVVRGVQVTEISRSGRESQRTTIRTTFANPADQAKYGGHVARKQVTTTDLPPSGKLESPLFPDKPWLTYAALQALPTNARQLKSRIDTLANDVTNADASLIAGQASAPTKPQSDSSRHGVTVTAPMHTVSGQSNNARGVAHDSALRLHVIAGLLALPVRPAERGALYRVAASLPGLRYDGVVCDQLGRKGEGVSIADGAGRLEMVFDKRTGALLQVSSSLGAAGTSVGFGEITQTLQTSAGM